MLTLLNLSVIKYRSGDKMYRRMSRTCLNMYIPWLILLDRLMQSSGTVTLQFLSFSVAKRWAWVPLHPGMLRLLCMSPTWEEVGEHSQGQRKEHTQEAVLVDISHIWRGQETVTHSYSWVCHWLWQEQQGCSICVCGSSRDQGKEPSKII